MSVNAFFVRLKCVFCVGTHFERIKISSVARWLPEETLGAF